MCNTYEEIEHTADIAIRVHAVSFQELVHQAALGMLYFMNIQVADRVLDEELRLTVSYVSREDILVQALNEMLFQLETGELVFLPDHIDMAENEATVHYTGCAWEEDFSEIKAVTYHQMEITEDFQGLHCMVVFDV